LEEKSDSMDYRDFPENCSANDTRIAARVLQTQLTHIVGIGG
jgi:hypothetical protein